MHDTAIRLEEVTRQEAGRPILEAVSLEVTSGTLCALVGADGAGKTTLMRVVAGLLEPQVGTVTVGGIVLYGANRQQQEPNVGYMPQKFGLYGDLSVKENLALYADLFGLGKAERKERFDALLRMTDLTRFLDREAQALSGGMKQKLGLACALLNRPKVLLLDEPSVGVDPLSRYELWEILRHAVRKQGMTVLVSTTYMDEAEKTDAVYILEEGHLVMHGTPAQIAHAAAGLTWKTPPLSTDTARRLQVELIEKHPALICDVVPQCDGLRLVLRGTRAKEVLDIVHPDLRLVPVEPDLEAGYIVSQAGPGEGTPLARTAAKPHGTSDTNTPSDVIVAQDLVRRFGNFTAVDNTSFTVKRGEIFGLLGPNGAGKTTTFKMLCGLLRVTSGKLTVAGFDAEQAREETRARLGYMSQKFSLYGDLSVMENLSFFALAYGLTRQAAKSRIIELLEEFDLGAYSERSAKTLSGGIKQRLAMACAIVHRPSILFLDEPTSGADIPTRREFWRRIAHLASDGTCVVVTTHFMQEALYCDRLLIQDAGKPLFLGTPKAMQGSSATIDEAFSRIVRKARTAGEFQ